MEKHSSQGGGFLDSLFGDNTEGNTAGNTAGNTEGNTEQKSALNKNGKLNRVKTFARNKFKSATERLRKDPQLEAINAAFRAGRESCKKKEQEGGKRKNKKKKKSKRSSKKKFIKSGATVYSHDDIVLITQIIDNILDNWDDKDKHHKYKMELKHYLKTEIDPPLTDEQINKLINRIAFFKENNTVDDNTTYPVIRSWIDSARGIRSRSKKKTKRKKKSKKRSKKNKHLRTSKIKKVRFRNK